MSRPRKYNTEEEKKAAKRERQRRWAKENPNYASEYRKKTKIKFKRSKKSGEKIIQNMNLNTVLNIDLYTVQQKKEEQYIY